MNRGIQTSAGALTPLARAQEILANNLANVSTTGFREDRIGFERVLQAAGGETPAAPAAPVVSRQLGTESGALDTTGTPLDLAIVGPGFFTVQTPQGQAYTRDGSLTMAPDGQLLHRSGHPLVGEGGPIQLPPGAALQIDADGTVRIDGESQGRLQIVSFSDPSSLRHAGRGLLVADGPGETLETARVVQGSVETSNVEPVGTMIEMMTVLRSFQANQSAITTQDQTLAQLVRWASS